MAIDLNKYRAGAVSMAAVIVAAVVAVTAFVYYGSPVTEAVAPLEPIPATHVATITVHVSGAVVSPGLVEVGPTSRVADVIAAAGGTAPEANLAVLNLAAPVRDGEQVVVSARGDGADVASDDQGRVRLNTASVSELEQIPGVGPVLAGRIVDARQMNGGFSTVEDLLDVSRYLIVLLADNLRLEDSGSRIERVDRRVDTKLGNLP